MTEDKCPDPSCHEKLKLCLHSLVPKKALWIGLVILGLPMLVTGIKVWSQQESDKLRFADKEGMYRIEQDSATIKVIQNRIIKDLEEIKTDQKEMQQDIKKILNHVRP